MGNIVRTGGTSGGTAASAGSHLEITRNLTSMSELDKKLLAASWADIPQKETLVLAIFHTIFDKNPDIQHYFKINVPIKKPSGSTTGTTTLDITLLDEGSLIRRHLQNFLRFLDNVTTAMESDETWAMSQFRRIGAKHALKTIPFGQSYFKTFTDSIVSNIILQSRPAPEVAVRTEKAWRIFIESGIREMRDAAFKNNRRATLHVSSMGWPHGHSHQNQLAPTDKDSKEKQNGFLEEPIKEGLARKRNSH